MATNEKPADGQTGAPGTGEGQAAEGAPPAAERPIIRKIIVDDGHGGAHGGAWKIALADMMTALMAFFLLMWLLGASNSDQRKNIADYFRPASHSQIKFGELAGSDGLLGGRSIVDPDGFPFTAKQTAMLERLTPRAKGGPSTDQGDNEQEANAQGPQDDAPTNDPSRGPKKVDDDFNFEKLQEELKEKLSENPDTTKLKDQVTISREADGLRIEIIDQADFSMFRLGTAELDPRAEKLLREVATAIRDLPNRVAVRGHTDSLGFAASSGRSNWTLSAERADATRRLMAANGISDRRFARIEGVADTDPFIPDNPADPRNRRVSITLLNQP